MCPMSPRLLRPTFSGLNLRQIAGLLDWWDASVASSLVLNGGFVEQWNPLAGSRPLTQSASNDRPGIGAINGRVSVLFDGSNDHLNNTTLGSQTKTIVAVIAANSGGTQGILGEGDSSNTANRKFIHSSGGFLSFSRQTAAVGNSPTKSTAQPQIAVASYETAEALRVDGATSGGTPSALISTTTGFVIGARFFSGVASTFYNGHVCEVATFSRVLSAAEITRVERYLAAKWGITLAPQVTNADAQDWINRVYANGGTVSASTATAVNTFCDAIDAAGIRSRFRRLNLFAGSSLSACLVPLYRGESRTGTQYGGTTDANPGAGPFVSGDYTETGASGGLLGNGTSKYLNTGFRTQDLPGVYDCHLAVWTRGGTVTTTTRPIGALGGSSDVYVIDKRPTAGGGNLFRMGGGTNFSTGVVDADAQSIICSRTSASQADAYKNATPVATQTITVSGVTGTTNEVAVFAGLSGATPAAWYNFRLAGYSIGAGLTSGQVTSFHNAWAAFQTALARGL